MSPGPLSTVDRYVPHTSTVPANAGDQVGLFVREKVRDDVLSAKGTPGPAVLFVHGGFAAPTAAFDLAYKDFSLMAMLADVGFDVFALSHTGYGTSPRPMMDDPRNVDREFQPLLIPHVLGAPQPPTYPFKLVHSRSEWDEILTVVRFIRELRGVDRVSLVAWSTGGPRAGGFAAHHPELVDRLVLFCPAHYQPHIDAPDPLPEPGAPMILQNRDYLLNHRWLRDVRCDGQLDDSGVQDAFWEALMQEDAVGATWGADGQGIMRGPSRTNYGWERNVGRITAPTLVLLAEYDKYERRLDTWRGLTVEQRVLVTMRCSSHFVQFERGRHVVQRAMREWLTSGSVDGVTRGELVAQADGRIEPGGC